MITRKVGTVGGALIVRLTVELREVGIKLGDNVNISIKGGKIIIEKEDKK
jgi:antitoxin component of MazEF toxin-antitoxin module